MMIGYLENKDSWGMYETKATYARAYLELCVESRYNNKTASATDAGIYYPSYTNTSTSIGYFDYNRQGIKEAKSTIINMVKDTWWDGNETTTCDNTWSTYCSCSPPVIKTPAERLREMIQSRQAPLVVGSRKSMAPTVDVKEMRARETLRRVLGEDKYKQFLRNGFVAVRAKSGLLYQIFPAHGVTAVWKDGQMVDRLCVVLRGRFPPTDSLIMRYLLILNDEKEFRSFAIKHSVRQPKPKPNTLQLPNRSLPELFRELKVA
jgi:hypothetical protein